jgi:hypothetical protein
VHYAFGTAVGDFTTGLSVSRKLKMDQSFGADGVEFSVLNTVGINTTFPSNKMAAGFDLGWKRGPWNVSGDVHYSGSYLNWSGTAGTGNANWNVVRLNGLYPVDGGQPVSAYTTVDLHVGYDFKEGSAKGVTISFEGSNILDKKPPFYNASVGYDTFNASPIGRLLTVGVNKKW